MDIDYIKLTLSIFTAVFFALLFNRLIEESLNNYKLNQMANGFKKVAEQLDIETQKSLDELKNMAKIQAIQTQAEIEKRNRQYQAQLKRQKAKQQAENAIRKTNMETCKFWRKEYSEKRTEYAKIYMESSCKRAMSY